MPTLSYPSRLSQIMKTSERIRKPFFSFETTPWKFTNNKGVLLEDQLHMQVTCDLMNGKSCPPSVCIDVLLHLSVELGCVRHELGEHINIDFLNEGFLLFASFPKVDSEVPFPWRSLFVRGERDGRE